MRFPRPRAALIALLWLLGWTIFGVLSAGQVLLREAGIGGAHRWRSVYNIVYFYWAWALVTPLVLGFADAIRIRAAKWAPQLGAHVLFAAVTILVQSTLYALFQVLDERARFAHTLILTAVMRHAAGSALTYATLVLAWEGIRYHQRSQAELLLASQTATRTVELEATLARVRLGALTAQLQPHFLFNTLNIISTLIARNDPVSANQAVARLGALLRTTLNTPVATPVPLRTELEFIRSYLDISRLRYGARLTIRETVDRPALDAPVPPFILQPIVENAVLHGVGHTTGPATIDIEARIADGRLRIEVRDNGPGFPPGIAGDGLGMSLARDRLRHTYGNSAQLWARNADGAGASVIVELPLSLP